jgi:hypothetical protein
MIRDKLIWILWPSFIVAGVAEVVFFTAFDPQEFVVFGELVAWSRTAMYSIGFFAFWALTAATSALTCFFQRPSVEINRCPLDAADRPMGCPKREDSGGD